MKEFYDYDPTPCTDEEIVCAVFYRYEQQISFYLYGQPTNLNSAAQKAVLQNVPKPHKYGGSSDFAIFDDWIIKLIQWMNIADQCGLPSCYSATMGEDVLTSMDLTRTNTIGVFLERELLCWLRNEVQKVPDGFGKQNQHLTY